MDMESGQYPLHKLVIKNCKENHIYQWQLHRAGHGDRMGRYDVSGRETDSKGEEEEKYDIIREGGYHMHTSLIFISSYQCLLYFGRTLLPKNLTHVSPIMYFLAITCSLLSKELLSI